MKKLVVSVVALGAVAMGMYAQGWLPLSRFEVSLAAPRDSAPAQSQSKAARRDEAAPAVTVVKAARAQLKELVLVTGTLVPRLEVLVSPEIEGQRVVELLADEGDRVSEGQVLARLERQTLESQLAQWDATLVKSAASIDQARSNIVAAEARRVEATNALDRARPLGKSGVLAEATLDQREATARTAVAQLRVAEDGLKVAEAERLQIEAQRRDVVWKLSRTEVRAPVAGIVSRRSARLGAVASGSAMAQPMFHMIANGAIELEADVPEVDLARLKPGMASTLSVMGSSELTGKIRLVSPEVDKASRLGRVRISLPDDAAVRIGSFGRGNILVRSGEGIAIPSSALLFGASGTYVQIVEANRVVSRKVMLGMQSGDVVEITSGLAEGEVVVARSGTFLRAGDLVTPVESRN